MNMQIIRSQSGDEMVILPRADYDRLIDLAEDAADIRDARDVLARLRSGAEETIPADVVHRLVTGENPIKVWREYRGLTQERLASASALSKMYLSQIERGTRQGSIKALRRLADALRVDLDDLATG